LPKSRLILTIVVKLNGLSPIGPDFGADFRAAKSGERRLARISRGPVKNAHGVPIRQPPDRGSPKGFRGNG